MKKADVQKMMRAAFFDAMMELMDDEPDKACQWLCKLHEELAWRLTSLLPAKKHDIDKYLDSVAFANNLNTGAYMDMKPSIEFTWGLLGMACASDMDLQLHEAKCKVVQASSNAVIPLFLKHAHEQIDHISRRILDLR